MTDTQKHAYKFIEILSKNRFEFSGFTTCLKWQIISIDGGHRKKHERKK
jgi:hypothetical protein